MFSKLRCRFIGGFIFPKAPLKQACLPSFHLRTIFNPSFVGYGRYLSNTYTTSASIPLPLTTQKAGKRKKIVENVTPEKERPANRFSVTGFALGSHFDLVNIQKSFAKHKIFENIPLPQEFTEGIALTLLQSENSSSREPSDIFIFRNGTAVLWNAGPEQTKKVRQLLLPHLSDRYEDSLIETEAEVFSYQYDETNKSSLSDEVVTFRVGSEREENILEKYSYSDALALSVKLGVLEEQFYKVVNKIEPWIQKLESGGTLWGLNQARVLKRTGELFTLRHLINVESDMTMTPDAYWENAKLERLFTKMSRVLMLGERCKDMNEKLNLCCEFMDLLSSHLHAQRSTRLEIMIIVLISVEVIFQFYYFFESRKKKKEEDQAAS